MAKNTIYVELPHNATVERIQKAACSWLPDFSDDCQLDKTPIDIVPGRLYFSKELAEVDLTASKYDYKVVYAHFYLPFNDEYKKLTDDLDQYMWLRKWGHYIGGQYFKEDFHFSSAEEKAKLEKKYGTLEELNDKINKTSNQIRAIIAEKKKEFSKEEIYKQFIRILVTVSYD